MDCMSLKLLSWYGVFFFFFLLVCFLLGFGKWVCFSFGRFLCLAVVSSFHGNECYTNLFIYLFVFFVFFFFKDRVRTSLSLSLSLSFIYLF
jgi:hypothetical protein